MRAEVGRVIQMDIGERQDRDRHWKSSSRVERPVEARQVMVRSHPLPRNMLGVV